MELTIQECNFLINAINVQATVGFKDGLGGSHQAIAMAMRLKHHASNLDRTGPETVEEVTEEAAE